jgi:uridine kinase
MDLIIIVGLPCSGKTTKTKDYQDNFIIFDDFLDNYYNFELKNNFKNNKKICINDPRLCNIKTFKLIMNDIFKYGNYENIQVLLFKNEYEKCLNNSINRNKDLILQNRINNTIKNLSKIYNLDEFINYLNTINNISYEILNVFN